MACHRRLNWERQINFEDRARVIFKAADNGVEMNRFNVNALSASLYMRFDLSQTQE